MWWRLSVGLFAVGCYSPTPPTGSPCLDGVCPRDLVCSAATQTCEEVDRDAGIDAKVIDTPGPAVTGNGTQLSPYVPTGEARTSCLDFLIAHPTQAGRNGLYRIEPVMAIDVFCDMTKDGGGWTLVARIAATSTTHATANAIGLLTDPTQAGTAKLADATINTLGFTHAHFVIETLGETYARVSSLDMTPTDFMLVASAAPSFAGPYTFDFLTQTGCGSDCGINVTRPNIGFGNNCGYQFYAQQGAPRPGMGCQGNAGRAGTVWVR